MRAACHSAPEFESANLRKNRPDASGRYACLSSGPRTGRGQASMISWAAAIARRRRGGF